MTPWDKFKKYIKTTGIVEAYDRVLLAVSGGPDSVAMLNLFWRLKKVLPVELAVVHMDHGLRKVSGKESRFVEKLAGKYKLPVILEKIPVREFAELKKISLETAGRDLRYKVLSDTALRLGFNKIATGHTADDNAETMIMWMLRGTGPEGLKGIPCERKLSGGISVIRPILSITKDELLDYLKSQRLRFCTDRSNFEFDYTRNKIRHKIIKELKKYNPRFVEHLSNLSKIMTLESDFLENLSEKALKKAVKIGKNKIWLDLKQFFVYNKTIQSRLLKNILPSRITADSIEKVSDFLMNPGKKLITLTGGWAIKKSGRKAFIYKT